MTKFNAADHGVDRAIGLDYIDPDLLCAAMQSWSREACWPPMQGEYPENREDNPALGNCLVDCLIEWAQEDYKSELVPGLMIQPGVEGQGWHFRQRTESGYIKDKTWQQTLPGSEFEEVARDDPFYKMMIEESFFNDDSLAERVGILLEDMKANGFEPKAHVTPANIMAKLDEIYAAYKPKSVVQAAPQNGGPAPEPF